MSCFLSLEKLLVISVLILVPVILPELLFTLMHNLDNKYLILCLGDIISSIWGFLFLFLFL